MCSINFYIFNFKDVNLNNLEDISEQDFIEIFESLKTNDSLIRFEAANCNVTDWAATHLNAAMEQNQKLKSLNLDTNMIGPETMLGLFKALASRDNTIIEVHLTNQAQENMG